MTTKFQEKVYKLCSEIPVGKVSTYGAIAKKLKSSARAVGQALRCNPYAPKVPCHRVVCSDGSLGGFMGEMNNKKKIMMLEKEGVKLSKNKIENFEKIKQSL